MLLKFKYFVKFLQQHGPEVYPEVRKEYIETLSRIYRSAICAPRPPAPTAAAAAARACVLYCSVPTGRAHWLCWASADGAAAPRDRPQPSTSFRWGRSRLSWLGRGTSWVRRAVTALILGLRYLSFSPWLFAGVCVHPLSLSELGSATPVRQGRRRRGGGSSAVGAGTRRAKLPGRRPTPSEVRAPASPPRASRAPPAAAAPSVTKPPRPSTGAGRAAVLQNMDTNPPLIVHQARALLPRPSRQRMPRSAAAPRARLPVRSPGGSGLEL